MIVELIKLGLAAVVVPVPLCLVIVAGDTINLHEGTKNSVVEWKRNFFCVNLLMVGLDTIGLSFVVNPLHSFYFVSKYVASLETCCYSWKLIK